MSSDILIPSEQRIKVVERADGKARLLIFSQRPGVYQFAVEMDWEEEGYARKEMSEISGLYGSTDEAGRDAKREIRSVRDQLTKADNS
jgi:hypothetical protein